MLDWKPKLNSRQRVLLADKLLDGANLTAGALVIGQLVTGQPVWKAGMLVGPAVWLTAMAISVHLLEEDSE